MAALHARGIVHRDLKPHNVLLTAAGAAKLSDMGLSRRLVPDAVSFETLGSGGSAGWRAPEQLGLAQGLAQRQTLALDVFSLGLVVHYCLTGGGHPFGTGVERDANIFHARLDLSALVGQALARDLLRGMLAHDAGARPSVAAALTHPLWWDAPTRLAFLIDVSDRVEGEDRSVRRGMRCFLGAAALSGRERGGARGGWRRGDRPRHWREDRRALQDSEADGHWRGEGVPWRGRRGDTCSATRTHVPGGRTPLRQTQTAPR